MRHITQIRPPEPSPRIRSGGQTGVDRAALDAALDNHYPITGWLPANAYAEDGPIASRYRKHLKCMQLGGYRERTLANVRDADLTLVIFHDSLQGGTRLTAEFAYQLNKPLILIDADRQSPEAALAFALPEINQHHPSDLNAAGPRASQWPDAYPYAYTFFSLFLQSQ